MKRILVIDDEESVVGAMKEVLDGLGFSTTISTDAVEGEQNAISEEYDLLLVDLKMPGKNGAEVTRSVLERKPELPVLVITGHPHDPLAAEALSAGARSLIGKPFEIGKIMDFLRD